MRYEQVHALKRALQSGMPPTALPALATVGGYRLCVGHPRYGLEDCEPTVAWSREGGITRPGTTKQRVLRDLQEVLTRPNTPIGYQAWIEWSPYPSPRALAPVMCRYVVVATHGGGPTWTQEYCVPGFLGHGPALGADDAEYQDYFYRIWCTSGPSIVSTPWQMFYRLPNIPLQIDMADQVFAMPGWSAPIDIVRARSVAGKRDLWYFVRTANAVAETPCTTYGAAPTIAQHASLPAEAFETRTHSGVAYVAVKDAATQNHAHGSLVGWKSIARDERSAEAEPYQGTGPTDLTADMYRIVKEWRNAGYGVAVQPPPAWQPGMDLMRWYEVGDGGHLSAYAVDRVDVAELVAAPGAGGFVLYEPAAGWKSGPAPSAGSGSLATAALALLGGYAVYRIARGIA